MMSRYCLKGKNVGTKYDIFEYATERPDPNIDDCISLEKSIDDVFKGNVQGVPDEWRHAFEIVECERLRRLSHPSKRAKHAPFAGNVLRAIERRPLLGLCPLWTPMCTHCCQASIVCFSSPSPRFSLE